MGNPLFCGQTDFIIELAATMIPIHYTTFVELWIQKMGDFGQKKRIPAHIVLRGVLTP